MDDNGPAPNSGPTDTKPLNRRPQDVGQLLIGVKANEEWFSANRKANRFFVVNLATVIGRLNLHHTKSEAYFKKAAKEIEKTDWKKQYSFEYRSSHTQIFPKNGPKNRDAPSPQTAKLFGHAATIIVAMEIAASELNPQLNVYDYLRILPAHFFVDHFNADKLAELSAFHSGLTEKEKIEKFGLEGGAAPFERTCLSAIEQYDGRLLQQVTQGYCVTKHTALKLVEHINKNYPSNLHVGPVRSSGDHAAVWGLGWKNTAPDFRAPRAIAQAELPPCF